jgi:Predicted permease.
MQEFKQNVIVLAKQRRELFTHMILLVGIFLVVLFAYVLRVQLRQISYYYQEGFSEGLFFAKVEVPKQEDFAKKFEILFESEHAIHNIDSLISGNLVPVNNYESIFEYGSLNGIAPYNDYLKEIELVNGRWPEKNNEIVLPENLMSSASFNNKNEYNFISKDSLAIGTYVVVGTYSAKTNLAQRFDLALITNTSFYRLEQMYSRSEIRIFTRTTINQKANSFEFDSDIWQAITKIAKDIEPNTATVESEYIGDSGINQELEKVQRINRMIPQTMVLIVLLLSSLLVVVIFRQFRKRYHDIVVLSFSGVDKKQLATASCFLEFMVVFTAILLSWLFFSQTYSWFCRMLQELLRLPYYDNDYFLRTSIHATADFPKLVSIIIMVTIVVTLGLALCEWVFISYFNPSQYYFNDKKEGEIDVTTE